MAGLNIEAKNKIKELKTGVHLVAITDAMIIKNSAGEPALSTAGEMGIIVRFTDGANQSYDQDYWLGGTREQFFISMCAAANIDRENPKFKKASKGKRLWICIKEIWDVDGEDIVKDELTGEPVINYYLFKTIPYIEPGKKPTVPGDPEADPKNNPSGQFLDYNQIDKDYKTENIFEKKNKDEARNKSKATVVAEAKKIIKEVESKKVYKEVDPFDEDVLEDNEEEHITSKQTHQEDNEEIDWDNI